MDHRVLIVDDNGAFRAAVRQLLEGRFAVVRRSRIRCRRGRGSEGPQRRTVAIVDVQLPDFDGFEVAARLSEAEAAPSR